MHYVLLYDYVDDYLEKRTPLRHAHLAYARTAVRRGELVLGGAFADVPYAGMLLFKTSSPAPVEEFAKNDPYVQRGVVRNWRVREWVTVIGGAAEAPVVEPAP